MTLRRAFAFYFAAAAALCFAAIAAPEARAEAMGIALEGFPYPYPVDFLPLLNDRLSLLQPEAGRDDRFHFIGQAVVFGIEVTPVVGERFRKLLSGQLSLRLVQHGLRVQPRGYGQAEQEECDLH